MSDAAQPVTVETVTAVLGKAGVRHGRIHEATPDRYPGQVRVDLAGLGGWTQGRVEARVRRVVNAVSGTGWLVVPVPAGGFGWRARGWVLVVHPESQPDLVGLDYGSWCAASADEPYWDWRAGEERRRDELDSPDAQDGQASSR